MIPTYHRQATLFIIAACLLLGVLISLGFSMLSNQNQFYITIAISAAFILGILAVIAQGTLRSNRILIALFLSLLVFMIDTNFRAKEFEDISLDWQNSIKLGLFSIALTLGIVGLRKTYEHFQLLPLGALVGYGGIALLSSLYSPIPAYTFGAALGFISVVLFVPWALENLSPQRFISLLLAALVFLQIVSWLWYFMFPEQAIVTSWTPEGRIPRLAGIVGQPNILGRIAAVAIGLCITSLWAKRERRFTLVFPIIALSIWTLLQTQSRASMGALVGALVVTYIVFRHKLRKLFILSIVGFGLLVFWIFSDPNFSQKLSMFIARTGDVQELITLTGRIFIWQSAWTLIAQSPWIGYGYATTRVIIPQNWDIGASQPQASSHALLLESLLNVGIVGTVFLIISVIATLVCILRISSKQLQESYPFAFMLLFNLIHGLAERGIVGVPNVGTITFVASVAFLSLRGRKRGEIFLGL